MGSLSLSHLINEVGFIHISLLIFSIYFISSLYFLKGDDSLMIWLFLRWSNLPLLVWIVLLLRKGIEPLYSTHGLLVCLKRLIWAIFLSDILDCLCCNVLVAIMEISGEWDGELVDELKLDTETHFRWLNLGSDFV